MLVAMGWASDHTDEQAKEFLESAITGYHGVGSVVGALNRLADTGALAAPELYAEDLIPTTPFLGKMSMKMLDESTRFAHTVHKKVWKGPANCTMAPGQRWYNESAKRGGLGEQSCHQQKTIVKCFAWSCFTKLWLRGQCFSS